MFIIYCVTHTYFECTRAPLLGDEPCPHLPCSNCKECKEFTKKYIGYTRETLKRRRERHEQAAINNDPQDNSIFHEALRCHGFDKFCWEQINAAATQRFAIRKENKAIIEYNTLMPNGYNMVLQNPDAPITKKLGM